MALQSSGQIKVSEIQSEIGQTASSEFSFADAVGGTYATINTASALYPNNIPPHHIAEWYGYDHSAAAAYSNDNYWDFDTSGLGLRFQRSAGTLLNTGNDISISMWVRPEWAASDTNAMLVELHNSTTATNNRLFIFYDYGLNRFVARLRTNGTNSRGTHWNLSSNSTQTGISSGNWHGSNVGNVNSAGLAHIVLTYDSSATSGSTAFDCYWNGAKMPNKVTNLTSTIFNFDYDKVSINRAGNGTSSSREAFYDNVAVFHNKLLSQSEITSLYNSGAGLPPTELSLDDNLAFQFEAEADPPVAVSGTDYTTTWSLSLDQGRAIAY